MAANTLLRKGGFARAGARAVFCFSRNELPDHPTVCEPITFARFVDLYVTTFAIFGLIEQFHEDQHREARITLIERLLDDARPAPIYFGDRPIAVQLAQFVSEGGHCAWFEKQVMRCIARIELSEGIPTRLHPFSRVPAEGSPQTILMDPLIRFGRPTVAERGVPTNILFERHQAGDSIPELAADYEVVISEVEEAIRFEASVSNHFIAILGG